MKDNNVIFWDIIICCRDVATGERAYQTFTQASGEHVSQALMRRNIRAWLRSMNEGTNKHYYTLDKIARSGELDSEITRLLSQGLVESANHTIGL